MFQSVSSLTPTVLEISQSRRVTKSLPHFSTLVKSLRTEPIDICVQVIRAEIKIHLMTETFNPLKTFLPLIRSC